MDRQARVGLKGWVDEQKDSVQSWQLGVRVERGLKRVGCVQQG